MAVSKRLRYEIFQRDNFTCRYCHADDKPLTVDHVVPVALGGSDKASNLVTACRDCNAGKSSRGPEEQLVENVADDAIRWGLAMQKAAEIHAERTATVRGFCDALDAVWCEGVPRSGYIPSRPPDWELTVSKFQQAGLTLASILDLATITLRNPSIYGADRHWKYFCGCCWREIRELQELAERIVREDSDG